VVDAVEIMAVAGMAVAGMAVAMDVVAGGLEEEEEMDLLTPCANFVAKKGIR
jgi:hypothetical protein